MWVGQVLGVKDELFFVRSFFAIFSLSVVWAFFWYGWRKGGILGAWTLGLFAVLWPDIVNGSIRTLGEFLGGNALVVGAILVVSFLKEKTIEKSLMMAFAAGFFLGSAAAIRFQLAPGSGIALLFLLQKRKMLPFIVGCGAFILPIMVLGIVDFYTLGEAFQSVSRNYYYNKTLGVVSDFGEDWFGYYIQKYILFWGAAFVFVLYCLVFSDKKEKIPLIVALFIIFYHSLIGHKEISFVYAAVCLVIFSTACGFWEVVKKYPQKKNVFLTALSLAMICIFMSKYSPYLNARSVGIKFERLVSKKSDVCGIALLDGKKAQTFSEIGGYAASFKSVPLYLYLNKEEALRNDDKYNYLIVSNYGISLELPHSWALLSCEKGRVCLYRKVQPKCSGVPDFEQFSDQLKSLGK